MKPSLAINARQRTNWVIVLSLIATLISGAGVAGNETSAHESDWQSPEAIVRALYDSISADAGEERDRERFLDLFIDGAQLAVAFDTPAISGLTVSTPQDLLTQTQAAYGATGFHETAVRTQVERIGLMANVTSSFEVRLRKSDPQPLMRGLNHFQLLNDGERWWIVSNTGILDTADDPLPKQWLSAD